MNFATRYPLQIQQRARKLGLATFDKTRFYSHISFLRKCLHEKVTPKGLQMNHFNPSLPLDISATIRSATFQCSRRIMKSYLQHFSNKVKIASEVIDVSKNELVEVCSKNDYGSIKLMIHILNQELFSSLKDTKDHKLVELGIRNRPNQSKNSTKRVFTIPEDLPLSEDQKAVLSRGLNFVPVSKQSRSTEIALDLEAFYRRVKLRAHFNAANTSTDSSSQSLSSKNETEDVFSKFKKKKSTWTPPDHEFEAVNTFIRACRSDIRHLDVEHKTAPSNLPLKETLALRELRNNPNIVVKPADKGGAVVVWRKDLYLQEALRQLTNGQFYEEVPDDLTEANQKRVQDVLQKEIKESRLPQSATNLLIQHPRCSKFYLLPKIHKLGNPGRPIVSACSCPTEQISKYLDSVLQPIVTTLPTYLKDTKHALQVIESFTFNAEGPKLLFTMDVKSLYTVIPNQEGLKALQHFLNKRSNKSPCTDTLLRLAELVLTLNCFKFDDKFYQQVGGVSMGTRMGPSYACLFVGYIEEQIDNTYVGKKPELHKRYIDDIFGATSMTQEELCNYIKFVQNFHPAIDFTFEISCESLPFLDATFSIKDSRISSTIHYKDTDTHSYLHYTSGHPRKCKNAIPFSQFLRLRRLCSDRQDYEEKASDMRNYFLERSYPVEVVDSALEKASNIDRHELLKQNNLQNHQERVPLVLTFHPTVSKIPTIVNRHWHFLSNDDTLGDIFQSIPVTAYRRGKNLKEFLTSEASVNSTGPIGTSSCNRSRCNTCEHVLQQSTISGPRKSIKVLGSFTCTSSNVVYCILCVKCSKLYIGETKRRLGDRFREHLRAARTADIASEVGAHFSSHGHHTNDMLVTAVKQFNSDFARKTYEKYLIHSVGTIDPCGINKM